MNPILRVMYMLALKLSGLNFEVEHACYIIMWGKNMETNLSKLHENKCVCVCGLMLLLDLHRHQSQH